MDEKKFLASFLILTSKKIFSVHSETFKKKSVNIFFVSKWTKSKKLFFESFLMMISSKMTQNILFFHFETKKMLTLFF